MRRRMLLGAVLFLMLNAFPAFGEEVTPGASEENSNSRTAGLPPPILINTARCRINYDIRNVGPSGVRQANLYLTRDDGRSWALYGTHEVSERTRETTERAPTVGCSAEVDLLREGAYGLYLVPKSGAGLQKKPPQPGTPPQRRVEVDLTAPVAELYCPEPQPDHSVILTWKVEDRNLRARPVALEWAATKRGPWLSISVDLENTGRHVWKLPVNLPATVYLRITARDRAGNVAVAETPDAVCLDTAEPEAVITSVEPATPER